MSEYTELQRALDTLREYVFTLSLQAEMPEEYGPRLWDRIKGSVGVLRELAYYHDYGEIYGKYQVAGYSLADILVWQVDHFKAYLDRPQEMNRYLPERLFLESLQVLLDMEKDPEKYVRKLQGETGTDFVGKYH